MAIIMSEIKTDLQRWVNITKCFEPNGDDAREDDDIYLIKRYARLRMSSLKELRQDYKLQLGKDCQMDLSFDEIVIKLMENFQAELKKPINPDVHLPRHMHPIDFNEDLLRCKSKGKLTRLIPGTVIEREYQGNVYVVYCEKGFYDYGGTKYNSLSDVASMITGRRCPGPSFFSRKTRMYMLNRAKAPEKPFENAQN